MTIRSAPERHPQLNLPLLHCSEVRQLVFFSRVTMADASSEGASASLFTLDGGNFSCDSFLRLRRYCHSNQAATAEIAMVVHHIFYWDDRNRTASFPIGAVFPPFG